MEKIWSFVLWWNFSSETNLFSSDHPWMSKTFLSRLSKNYLTSTLEIYRMIFPLLKWKTRGSSYDLLTMKMKNQIESAVLSRMEAILTTRMLKLQSEIMSKSHQLSKTLSRILPSIYLIRFIVNFKTCHSILKEFSEQSWKGPTY